MLNSTVRNINDKNGFGSLGLLLVLVVVLLSLLGWIIYSKQTKNKHNQTQINSNVLSSSDFILEKSSSGGFAGNGDGRDLTINQNGEIKFLLDGKTKKLSTSQIHGLNNKIQNSGILKIKSQSFPPGGDDCVNYVIKYESIIFTNSISFDDCNLEDKNFPAKISDLYMYLASLGN
jgi:hypothetical protein